MKINYKMIIKHTRIKFINVCFGANYVRKRTSNSNIKRELLSCYNLFVGIV